MKRVPKKIEVGPGCEYTTIYRWRPLVDGQPVDGAAKLGDKQIILDRALKTERRQVYLHEVFHAVLWEAGISRSFNKKQHDTEELIVDCLSRWVDNVLLKK